MRSMRISTFPSGENFGVIHSPFWTYKFTIDKRSGPLYDCACYLEQTSRAARTPPALTLALSIACSLFVLLPQPVSFVFNSLQPLFQKHRGWGIPNARTGHPGGGYGDSSFGHPLFTTHYSPATLL